MNREEILKEIDDAMAELRDVKAKVNEALCHARNIVTNEPQIPYSEAYNKGLEDAWKLARKISDIPTTQERADIFGFVRCGITVGDILRNMDYQEALAKLEAYEKEQEIKVGDVCKFGQSTMVVTKAGHTQCHGFFIKHPNGENGKVGTFATEHLKKTGKHIDISSILE